MEKVFYANENFLEARVTILILHKIDFKTKAIIKDKKGHCIGEKRAINLIRRYNLCKHMCTQHRNT